MGPNWYLCVIPAIDHSRIDLSGEKGVSAGTSLSTTDTQYDYIHVDKTDGAEDCSPCIPCPQSILRLLPQKYNRHDGLVPKYQAINCLQVLIASRHIYTRDLPALTRVLAVRDPVLGNVRISVQFAYQSLNVYDCRM